MSAGEQKRYLYAIGLGSNRRHGVWGSPREIISAAMAELPVVRRSATIISEPIGPSHRRYANAVALIETGLEPKTLLASLKAIEQKFGRRRGQRWGARVIDLDIVLWSGGAVKLKTLTVPHVEFRRRRFVMNPLVTIAPDWRDPASGLCVKHLKVRLDRARPCA